MEILRFSANLAEQIGQRPYEVKLASSIEFAEGEGEAHAYIVYFEAGGVIGPHEAGFGQIFFAAAGSGWVAGLDNQRSCSPRARQRSSVGVRCTRRAAKAE